MCAVEQRYGQRRSQPPHVALGAVVGQQIDDGLRNAQRLGDLAGMQLGEHGRGHHPEHAHLVDRRIEQGDLFGGQPGSFVMAIGHGQRQHRARKASGQRDEVTGCGAQLAQIVESGLVGAAAHPPCA